MLFAVFLAQSMLRWLYHSVIVTSACPATSLIAIMFSPMFAPIVMNEWRRSCILMCGSPAWSNAHWNAFLSSHIGLVMSLMPGKTYGVFRLFVSFRHLVSSSIAVSLRGTCLGPVLLSSRSRTLRSSATSVLFRSLISEYLQPVSAMIRIAL